MNNESILMKKLEMYYNRQTGRKTHFNRIMYLFRFLIVSTESIECQFSVIDFSVSCFMASPKADFQSSSPTSQFRNTGRNASSELTLGKMLTALDESSTLRENPF